MSDPLELVELHSQQIDALFERLLSPDTDHRSAMTDLTSSLAAHISVEDSILLPVVRKSEPGGRGTWRAIRKDHRRMGRLLTLIERRKINSPDVPELITSLRSDWRKHADRHSALKCIDERLTEAERQDLAQKISRAESVILSHPHPHLLALGPLSRITTRLAARFDRARDRTVQNVP
jgi:iron-sulfur cluster repair protein YtfE (RIC family)